MKEQDLHRMTHPTKADWKSQIRKANVDPGLSTLIFSLSHKFKEISEAGKEKAPLSVVRILFPNGV